MSKTLLIVFGILIGIIFTKIGDNIFPVKCPCEEVKQVIVSIDTTIKTKTTVDSSNNIPVKTYSPVLKLPKANVAVIIKTNPLVIQDPVCNDSQPPCDDTTRVYDDYSEDGSVHVHDSIQGKRVGQTIEVDSKQLEITKTISQASPPVKVHKAAFYIGTGMMFNNNSLPFLSGTLQLKKNTYAVLIDPINRIYGAQIQFKLL